MTPVNAPTEATQGASRKRKSGSANPDVIKVEVEPFSIASDEKREAFWIGTLPDCPVQNVTAGGACFARYSGTPTFDEKGEPDRDLAWGAEVQLSDADIERIKIGVSSRILRRVGPKGKQRGMIIMRDGPYRVQAGDEPLGRYLYMQRGRRGHEFPEPMVD